MRNRWLLALALSFYSAFALGGDGHSHSHSQSDEAQSIEGEDIFGKPGENLFNRAKVNQKPAPVIEPVGPPDGPFEEGNVTYVGRMPETTSFQNNGKEVKRGIISIRH